MFLWSKPRNPDFYLSCVTRLLALPSFDHDNTEIYMLKETDTDRERKGGYIQEA